jgi:hypothetical protein
MCVVFLISIGYGTGFPVINTLCGNIERREFRSTGRFMTIQFNSDWSDNYYGFSFSYQYKKDKEPEPETEPEPEPEAEPEPEPQPHTGRFKLIFNNIFNININHFLFY